MADDEIAHRKALGRAARAKALAEDELLQEGFSLFEADLMRLWRNTKTDATSERERIWSMIRAVDMVRKHLEGVIADGNVSAAVIEAMLGRRAA